jgi:integrase
VVRIILTTDSIEKELQKQPNRTSRHVALPYSEVNAFISDPRKASAHESTRLAFEFLILTATRTDEVILAKWLEIDFEEKVWTIPANRMKAGKKHRIPLSARCIEILARAQHLYAGGLFLFPGRFEKKPLSTTGFLMMIRRMGKHFTADGFRSSFRDWAAEQTNFSREVCEMALAHKVSDKTGAAYLSGDLFDERRALMDTWAAFATVGSDEKIVTLGATPAWQNFLI